MNTPISELNEIALAVSNVLKGFDPKTMFWNENGSVAFTNFNQLQVQPYPDTRKPFGAQSILESFARSLGFKSYNGLLNSGLKSVQLRNDALYHLNPNPLNPYYTDAWECLTYQIMEDVINSEILPVSIIKNFKKSPLLDLLPYSELAIFNCVTVEKPDWKYWEKKIRFNFIEQRKKYMPFYTIACSMYYMALEKLLAEKGFSEWFTNEQIDYQAVNKVCSFNQRAERITIRIAMTDMLVKNQWGDTNHSKFLQNISQALGAFFSTHVSFEGEGRSPLDKVAVFKINLTAIPRLMCARVKREVFQNFQKACAVLIEEFKDDHKFYTCDQVHINKYVPSIIQHCANHLNYKYHEPSITALNGAKYFGRKCYWVNLAFGKAIVVRNFNIFDSMQFDEKEEGVISVEECIATIREYLDKNLKPVEVDYVKPLFDEKPKYQQRYITSTEDKALAAIIPDSFTINSDYPLKHYLGENYIQDVLIEMLSINTDIDMDEKLIGHPDELVFSTGEKITIKKTLSPIKTDGEYEFYALHIVSDLALLFDFGLDEVVGLPDRKIEDKQLYYETEDKIFFSASMRLLDMLYKFNNTQDTYSYNADIPMLATIDKKTQRISLKFHNSLESVNNGILFGYEDCENTQQIYDYLIGIAEVHELIYKYLMQFYSGKHKNILDKVVRGDTVMFEIYPSEIISKGYGDIDDIVEEELNIF